MEYTWYEAVLFFAGTAALLRAGISFLASLYSGLRGFIFPKLGIRTNLRKLGDWAVVTGATDGIGKAYADGLARKGINIVLVSRNPEKLAAVAKEIESAHRVQTRIVRADFVDQSPALYDSIASQIEDLDVGILVNNVGAAYDYPDYFLELSTEKIQQLMAVNMTSVTLMTRALLPRLVARKRGAIINISSHAGTAPTPLLAVYSAAKAYVDVFTQALQQEYESKGIIVQSVLPLFVASKMSGIRRTSFFVPSPKGFVGDALGSVGALGVTPGCPSHSLQAFAMGLLPDGVQRRARFSMLAGVRERALKKLKRSQ